MGITFPARIPPPIVEHPTAKGGLMPDTTKGPQGGAPDYTQWHEVKKGETLSKIAQQYYGDASLYPKIFEANTDVLKDPDKIRIGQKLRIP